MELLFQIDYVDIAGKYRDYLTTDYGVSQSEAVNNSPLYIDLFGGVVKTEPILGIPVQMAYEATSFDEAADMFPNKSDFVFHNKNSPL